MFFLGVQCLKKVDKCKTKSEGELLSALLCSALLLCGLRGGCGARDVCCERACSGARILSPLARDDTFPIPGTINWFFGVMFPSGPASGVYMLVHTVHRGRVAVSPMSTRRFGVLAPQIAFDRMCDSCARRQWRAL